MVLAKRSIVIRSLRAVNLNLLPALRVLLRFRQVSRAAKALNMSQSSVSEILGSLRHLFNDELLVSDGNSTRLTALGERLESQIDTPLKLIERLTNVDTPGHSAPAPTIDIAASDYTMAVVAPRLIECIQSERPEMTLRFHCIDGDTRARISAGEIDFLITPEIPIGLGDPQFARQILFEDRIVAMIDAKSAIQHHLSEEAFWSAPHIFFHPNPDIYNPSRTTVLQHIQEQRPDAVLVENHLIVPFLVEHSDAVALMSSGLVNAVVPCADVRTVEAPFEVRVRVFASWDGSRAQNANQFWFLKQLNGVSRTIKAAL